MKIINLHARELLDSRGNPTLEVELTLDNNMPSCAIVPSGASTGENEAIELRDGDKSRFQGKGVLRAVDNVNTAIFKNIKNKVFYSQAELDSYLIDLDGTQNKGSLGANAILGVSMAFARAIARYSKIPLYKSFDDSFKFLMPAPMINIINGGSHANNNIDIQEFMIVPVSAPNFKESLRYGAEVFHCLKKVLNQKQLNTAVGDEGGFAPSLKSDEQAIEFIIQSIESAGFVPGKDISICLDVAANELKEAKNVEYFTNLLNKYPIKSIEDPFSENDWSSWSKLMNSVKKTQIVGDDLYVTNLERLKKFPISNFVFETGRYTRFIPKSDVKTLRKQWILSIKTKGKLKIDRGAIKALINHKSLLPAGVIESFGSFERGDAVEIISKNNIRLTVD